MTAQITSAQNERVKAVAALQRSKGRRSAGRFLVEGQHPVAEAAADGWLEEIFCLEELRDEWTDRAPRVTTVDERVLQVLSAAVSPQGVVAVATMRTVPLADVVGRGVLVVLCEAADPGNVGTIIRTADAVAAAGVVLTAGSVDPFSPKVARSTAGSITHVPLVTGVTVDEVVAACQVAGQRLVGLDGQAAQEVGVEGMFAAPVALVMGSEAHGLSAEVRPHLDALARLPVYGRAESLNLAVATSVALYEAARQQRP